MPSAVTVGYSAVICSVVIAAAMQSKITLTGTRVPAITAWPCITAGSAEIIAICSLVTVSVAVPGPRTRTRYPHGAAARRAAQQPVREYRPTGALMIFGLLANVAELRIPVRALIAYLIPCRVPGDVFL
jgi:hypothetical protein